MNAPASTAPPKSFTIVNVVLLLWMLMGIAAFAMDLMSSPESIAAMTPEQQQLMASRPQWLFYVYGLATGSGLLGAIGLLMKKAWAVPMLTLSFVVVIIQMGYTLFGLDAIGVLGAAAAVPFPVFICVMGGFAMWWAMRAKSKGWLA